MTASEFAPAKLNLALHVRARAADGYHDLESLFVFADVGDTVTWEGEAAPHASTLTIDGPFAAGLAADANNLVLAAARTLADAAGVARGARLALTKRLPVASGIGGGSADAAATLRLLNRVWDLGWTLPRLAELGATLGADVPACVHATPMRGEGRGERLVPLDFAGAHALLVNPGVAVSTRAVFAMWDGVDRGALAPGDALAAACAGRNDLEAPARALAPVIGASLTLLAASPGAYLARMSGSGATCFALYDRETDRARAAESVRAAHPGWWVATVNLLPA